MKTENTNLTEGSRQDAVYQQQLQSYLDQLPAACRQELEEVLSTDLERVKAFGTPQTAAFRLTGEYIVKQERQRGQKKNKAQNIGVLVKTAIVYIQLSSLTEKSRRRIISRIYRHIVLSMTVSFLAALLLAWSLGHLVSWALFMLGMHSYVLWAIVLFAILIWLLSKVLLLQTQKSIVLNIRKETASISPFEEQAAWADLSSEIYH